MPSWAKLIAVLGAVWLSVTHLHASTDVETAIVNQATLTYVDQVTGELVELKSNISSIFVAPLRQYELLSNNNIEAIAGNQVTLPHSLHNIGNVDDRYFVSVENELADSGDLINLLLYVDINNNGAVDSEDPIVDSELNVAAGESINLLISGLLPEELLGNDEVKLLLYTNSVSNELTAQTNTDIISITPSANITIDMQSSQSCDVALRANDRIDLTLSAVNQTQTLPDEREIIVDGEIRSGVLLEFELPRGLMLLANDPRLLASGAIMPIVSFSNTSDEWMRFEHFTGESIAYRMAFLIPQNYFSLDQKIEQVFSLLVSQSRSDGETYFSAGIDLNVDGSVDVESKPICITTVSLGATARREIRFVEPRLNIQASSETPSFAEATDFIDATVYRLYQSELSGVTQSSEDGAEQGVILSDGRSENYRLDLNGVYVELVSTIPAGQLIVDRAGVQYALVSVKSKVTGDEISLLLRETTPGSHLYRSIRPLLLHTELSADGAFCPGDKNGTVPMAADYSDSDDVCALKSALDDTISASFTDAEGGFLLSDSALVEPVSRVFDSTSLQGIAGVRVSVAIDGVVQAHPVTGQPLVYTTDDDGRYTLPRLLEGSNYSIQIEAPISYVFPSSVGPEQFASFSVSQASYGVAGYAQSGTGVFAITANEPPPAMDIPLDPANRNALLVVEKSAESEKVDLGETVSYSIKVKNRSDGELSSLAVIDYPAYGFRYQPGSASFNGDPVVDPQRLTIASNNAESGQEESFTGLRFQLSKIAANSEGILQYHMRATAGAGDGSGINRANANATTASGLVLSTPTSIAKVAIERSGVLSDQAIVFGKVYVDSSCDNIQNRGEWPIGGVRLYLQDGTFVVTDEDGQFSLFGLDPGLHVIKLDMLSMPEGLALKPIDTGQAADPESRFIELSAGDFHRADFASFCPQQNADRVFEELKQRNLNLRDSWLLNEATRFDPEARAPSVDDRTRADTDGDLSQGMLGFPRVEDKQASATRSSDAMLTDSEINKARELDLNGADNKPDKASSVVSNTDGDGYVLSARQKKTSQMGNPKEMVKIITQEQSKQGTWLWPETDLSWDGRFMVVIASGVDPTLYVNKKAVPHAQIGEQIVNRRERAQLVAWYGVQLLPGLNHLEVKAEDSFGNERVLAEASFRRPSSGVRLLLRTKEDTLEADGGISSLPIDIVITDANNNPAHGVYFVTLQSSGGAFVEEDLQLREPGMQVRVENGRGRVHLRSTELTGNMQVSAKTGALDAKLNIVQIAAARPLIGAGLIDIGGQWNSASREQDRRANLEDGFNSDARVALFLKGRIKNDLHLSLSYDSHKNKNTDVLRDLNPNEHYATYGDSSRRGVEAQSRSKLYLKLEKDKNSVMWGDYLTDSNSDHDDLGRVQRTLTGVNSVFDNGRTRMQAFAAQESSSRASEEIPGNGTALLYQLTNAPIVVNSEVIELIVRDRDNPGLVVSSRSLQRYIDYSIDFSSGFLRFTDVVPTVDSDLNPVFIRVAYDLNRTASEHLISGVRMLHDVDPRLSIGASLTDDQNPTSGYMLGSVSAIAQVSLNTKVTTTAAYQIHRAAQTDADAQRVTIEHDWKGRRDYRTAMTWARASRLFDNSAAGISKGREEWRIEHRQPLGNTTRARAEASRSRSLTEINENTTLSLNLEKTFSDWSLSAGARHVRSRDLISNFTFNTIMLGAEKRFTLSNGSRGSIGVDYERDVDNKNRYRFGLSSRLQVHKHVTAYTRFELEQALSFQSYTLNSGSNRLFTAGIESDVLPSTKLYSEYRLRDGVSGGSIETASGIRGSYEIQPKLTVSPAFEVIDARRGTGAEDSLSVSLGVSDNRNPNRKLDAQAEVRETESSRYYGFRGTVAQRLNVDWTGLLREEFSRQSPGLGELTSRHRMTVGFARRPKLSNEQHALYMANWKVDYGPQDGQDRTSYLLSTHQNRQISSNANLSGRFGARWTNTEYENGSIASHVMMADLRGTFDIRKRWELDLRGGWLGTGGPGDGRYSFGFGLAWIAERNLRLGLRYNVIGFREDDLDEQGFNAKGVRLGLQVKFDEDWFKWLE